MMLAAASAQCRAPVLPASGMRWPKVKSDTHISNSEPSTDTNGDDLDIVEPTDVTLHIVRTETPP